MIGFNEKITTRQELYSCIPSFQPYKRKPEQPLFFHLKKSPQNISAFLQMIEEYQWKEDELALRAFHFYSDHPIRLQGYILDQLLRLFFSSFPYLERFIEFIKLYRKGEFYLTKDEWCMLYIYRHSILDDKYCDDDTALSIPLILDDFMKAREESSEMECV